MSANPNTSESDIYIGHRFTRVSYAKDPYHDIPVDRRHCFSIALEQAMIAEYKAYWQKKLRADRRLLGNEFADDEVTTDLIDEESRLQEYLLTINFVRADGDPHWAPEEDYPSIVNRMAKVAKWKCLNGLCYCFEWSKKEEVLHVHLSFRWVGNGGFYTILSRFKQAFCAYINQPSDVDLRKCNKNMIWYIKKSLPKHAEKLKVYNQYRLGYNIEPFYQTKKKSKKEKKST